MSVIVRLGESKKTQLKELRWLVDGLYHGEEILEKTLSIEEIKKETEQQKEIRVAPPTKDQVNEVLQTCLRNLSILLKLEDHQSQVRIQGHFALIAFVLNQNKLKDQAVVFIENLGVLVQGIPPKNNLLALSLLYDALEFTELRPLIFRTMMKLAVDFSLVYLLIQHISRAKTMIESWSVSTEEKMTYL